VIVADPVIVAALVNGADPVGDRSQFVCVAWSLVL